MSDRPLPVQFRVYPDRQLEHRQRGRVPVNQVVVFDCETTTDRQRLLFGGYTLMTVRENDDGSLSCFTSREGFFYADDLEEFYPEGMAELREYVATHQPDTDPVFPAYGDQVRGQLDLGFGLDIELISASQFVESYILKSGYSDVMAREYQPATIVGFNLSFDIWRLVTRVTEARGSFYRGLSGEFLNGAAWCPNYREAKAGISMRRELTRKARSGDKLKWSPAYLVDLSELVRALTGRPHTLLSAGKHFGCRVLKSVEAARPPSSSWWSGSPGRSRRPTWAASSPCSPRTSG